MSFGPSGAGPKKESIFSSLAPAPAPAPAAAPAPAPRPAVDAEAVSALKSKIDALEKNIVSQLEKKFAEQFKAQIPAPQAAPDHSAAFGQKLDSLERLIAVQLSRPAPPPQQPPQRPLEEGPLFRKIEELEHRLSDLGRSATFSASQMKNIEESKIGARREIEDLLKAVREQQKFSEMDRQMHDQLEKAWARAEDMERKLMDFYTSVLAMEAKRRDEAAAASDRSGAAIEALAARLAGLEEKLGAIAARPADEGLKRAAADFTAAIAAEREAAREEREAILARTEQDRRAMLAAQSEAVRENMSSLKENAASFKETFDSYVRHELELLRDKVSGESEGLRRDMASMAEESRKFLRAQSGMAAEKAAEMERMLRENRLKADGVETALEAASRRQAAALEEFGSRLTADMLRTNSDYAAAVKRESDERFEKFGAKYADALLSVTFVEGFRTAVSEAVERLQLHKTSLSVFLGAVSPEQLAKAMGVSGDLVRKNLASLTAAAESIGDDVARLRVIKAEVEGRFKDIFGDR
jgi:hypothetical protein